jgi:hypothetical protein
MSRDEIAKICSCGAFYSAAELADLPRLGTTTDRVDRNTAFELVLANCLRCGSTMSIAERELHPRNRPLIGSDRWVSAERVDGSWIARIHGGGKEVGVGSGATVFSAIREAIWDERGFGR